MLSSLRGKCPHKDLYKHEAQTLVLLNASLVIHNSETGLSVTLHGHFAGKFYAVSEEADPLPTIEELSTLEPNGDLACPQYPDCHNHSSIYYFYQNYMAPFFYECFHLQLLPQFMGIHPPLLLPAVCPPGQITEFSSSITDPHVPYVNNLMEQSVKVGRA
ncbi:hypothetical protein BDQ12DRAFT_724501 [Crucibulum laeve]|uniref:Uncharacterized protein n=1 Tax=Crucibulum laeve TaxID=68775 RepID=A0A5C3LV34_9AGAR|nr:hypothetical protein BDQ12DRAFT_724501 [Crucibulum laeve]